MILNYNRVNYIGSFAASLILKSLPGNWEIPLLSDNAAAIRFWTSVIDKVIKHQSKVFNANTPDWNGLN
jgi:predicted acetyltransferase